MTTNATTRYYIAYPYPKTCGLGCWYCFDREAHDLRAGGFDDKFTDRCPFTPRQFMAWRDRHLADGGDFIVDLHGGEISDYRARGAVFDIIDTIDKSRFQLQTNGLGPNEFYSRLAERRDRIDRIGFTFHREIIGGDATKCAIFADNVRFVQGTGIEVYVKELLLRDRLPAILKNKEYWQGRGVGFRLQDFKGGRGVPPLQYTPDELALIHPEYRHGRAMCACREGYRNVIIRGYDIFAGDVIACWEDPVVVGSITDDWYRPDYEVTNVNGHRRVRGVPRLFRGSAERDMWKQGEGENLTKKQLTERGIKMKAHAKDFVDRLEAGLESLDLEVYKAQKEQARLQSRIDELRDTRRRTEGAINGIQQLLKEAGGGASVAAVEEGPAEVKAEPDDAGPVDPVAETVNN